MIAELFIVAMAYLLGSIPTALLLVRVVTGGDVRTTGSGNVGGTNAARAAGLKVGVAVTLVDMAKGAVPVVVMQWYNPASRWMAMAMLAAVAGHIFPVWLKFRGGKGVATGFGAFLVLAPGTAFLAFGVWFVVVALTRYVALGSMLASAVFPVLLFFTAKPLEPVIWGVVAIAVLIVFRHQSNMRNILDGTEPKIGYEKWE
jgi:glycerol-3-phosphate acyltransferase PlsY